MPHPQEATNVILVLGYKSPDPLTQVWMTLWCNLYWSPCWFGVGYAFPVNMFLLGSFPFLFGCFISLLFFFLPEGHSLKNSHAPGTRKQTLRMGFLNCITQQPTGNQDPITCKRWSTDSSVCCSRATIHIFTWWAVMEHRWGRCTGSCHVAGIWEVGWK